MTAFKSHRLLLFFLVLLCSVSTDGQQERGYYSFEAVKFISYTFDYGLSTGHYGVGQGDDFTGSGVDLNDVSKFINTNTSYAKSYRISASFGWVLRKRNFIKVGAAFRMIGKNMHLDLTDPITEDLEDAGIKLTFPFNAVSTDIDQRDRFWSVPIEYRFFLTNNKKFSPFVEAGVDLSYYTKRRQSIYLEREDEPNFRTSNEDKGEFQKFNMFVTMRGGVSVLITNSMICNIGVQSFLSPHSNTMSSHELSHRWHGLGGFVEFGVPVGKRPS